MSSRARIGIIAAAVVVLVVGFVIASGSGDDDNKAKSTATTTAVVPAPADTTATGVATTTQPTTPAPPAVPTVRVVDAKPRGGVKRISFTKGETIKFRVRSDTADEIHFHGYDIAKDVKAGGSVTFSVPATIEGRFVVELEQHETQIAEVEVNPS